MKVSEYFIVMPITTPDPAMYSGDSQHFRHVLDHLFIPAIEKAGLTQVPPMAEGADVIHAEIIRNIERTDLVLCDMSNLNPNVFFELGIRTAVNKPVCVVKDDLTPQVPFDTTIINYHTYLSSLTPWTLAQQIESLAEHIGKSVQRSSGQNMMWKYFGLSTRAELSGVGGDTEQQLELLKRQMAELSNRLPISRSKSPKPLRVNDIGEQLFQRLVRIASSAGRTIRSGGWGEDGRIYIQVVDEPPDEGTWKSMLTEAAEAGYELSMTVVREDS